MKTATMSRLATLALATAVAACGDARASDASRDDLKRDLELASATTMNLAAPAVDSALLNSMETQPQSAPAKATVVKKGAGPRAVRSESPTVEAEADVDVAALDETEEVETERIAPAPEISEPIAVAPRPQPVVVQTGGAGDYGTGSGTGSGPGAVLRGGGVHGDNCDLHRGRGGIVFRGPVYVPRTVTNVGPRGGNPTSGGSSVTPRDPQTRGRLGTTRQPASRPMRGIR